MRNPRLMFFFARFGKVVIITAVLFYFVLLTSCKSEIVSRRGEYEVSGVVVDELSGKPISNARLLLTRNSAGFGFYLGPEIRYDSFFTDNEGKFIFFFDSTHKSTSIKCNAANYKESDRLHISSRRHTKDLRFELTPYGYARLHVPALNETLMYLELYGDFNPGYKFKSLLKDTICFIRGLGNTSQRIVIRKTFSDNSVVSLNDDIYFPALDTVDYYVKF